MTRAQYQKMIKNSAVFGYLSKDFREEALLANDDDMARYTALFEDANALTSRADSDMRAANDDALNEFRQGLREENAAIEDKTRKSEEENQQNLLDELDKT